MKPLLLFDVDGTIAESGEDINEDILLTLEQLKTKYDLGIVGGGKFEVILRQTGGIKLFTHIFSECGCVYNQLNNSGYETKYVKNIREHSEYKNINKLIKTCLNFLSKVDYELTGHFVDLRSGIVYISLIGMSANEIERKKFIKLNEKFKIRKKLLTILQDEIKDNPNIKVQEGGQVGICICPKEYDKVQVLEFLKDYYEISFFCDKYRENGNDFELIHHEKVKGFKINCVQETLSILQSFL